MQTITSKEVAEMLGKRHDNLLRDIRKYIATLGEDAPQYFTEVIGGGRGIHYAVTKAGCDLMAGRIIGEKSVAFKAKYSPVFGGGSVEVEELVTKPKIKEYTVDEVAKVLGVSERSVYRNIQAGKLEAVQREIMIPTTKMFITEDALVKYKAERGMA